MFLVIEVAVMLNTGVFMDVVVHRPRSRSSKSPNTPALRRVVRPPATIYANRGLKLIALASTPFQTHTK